jgi:hypothetical protein
MIRSEVLQLATQLQVIKRLVERDEISTYFTKQMLIFSAVYWKIKLYLLYI